MDTEQDLSPLCENIEMHYEEANYIGTVRYSMFKKSRGQYEVYWMRQSTNILHPLCAHPQIEGTVTIGGRSFRTRNFTFTNIVLQRRTVTVPIVYILCFVH